MTLHDLNTGWHTEIITMIILMTTKARQNQHKKGNHKLNLNLFQVQEKHEHKLKETQNTHFK